MQKLIQKIKEAKSIAIFSHISPDPDAIGSALALRRMLISLGKNADVYCSDEIREDYFFLADAKLYNTENRSHDLLISVDVSSSYRLGKFDNEFLKFDNTIKIDHHKTVEDFAKINYVVPCSASSVLIYELSKQLKISIDSETATLLYFGICGDTCIFTNSGTDPKSLIYAGELLEKGADKTKVYSEFFEKREVNEVHMKSHLLLGADINDALGYVIMDAPTRVYKKFNESPDSIDIGNLPNTYLSCGYKIAAVLKQKEDGIHVSLRSKPEYDVSVVAERLGGGGHKNASGYLTKKSYSKAREELCLEIEKYLKEQKDVK